MLKKLFASLVFLLSFINLSFAQEHETTAGFQFKPIIPRDVFSSGIQQQVIGEDTFMQISPRYGFAAGMVIRHGLTDRLSFETGINYAERNFTLSYSDNSFSGEFPFKIVGYEIPVQGLVYIRIGENSYMNSALGIVFNYFPSNIHISDGENVLMWGFRQRRLNLGFTGNAGYEFRTANWGYFYLGGTYHQPFSRIFVAEVIRIDELIYERKGHFDLTGNYITIDLRYFFPIR